MHDPLVVGDLESLGDLARNRQRRREWQPTAASVLLRDAGKHLRKRLAVHEFENEEPDGRLLRIVRSGRLLEAVDRADVGVVQRREHPGLALEASEAIRVARERAGQDLDGDITTQLRVPCLVDVTHPARSEQGGQLIAAEGPADHVTGARAASRCAGMTSTGSSRKLLVRRGLGQQRLDVAPQRFVIGTGDGEKRRPLTLRQGVCGVIEVRGRLPAFRRHVTDHRASRVSAMPWPAASHPSRSRATRSGPRPSPPRSIRRRTASR